MLLPPFDKSSHGARFLRGNLHGHSAFSDGAKSKQDVVKTYKALGYDFICISDHLWNDQSWAARRVNDTRHLSDDTFTLIQGAELHAKGKAYDSYGLWHILANGLPLDFACANDLTL